MIMSLNSHHSTNSMTKMLLRCSILEQVAKDGKRRKVNYLKDLAKKVFAFSVIDIKLLEESK